MQKDLKLNYWITYFCVGLSMVNIGIVLVFLNDILKVSGFLSIIGGSLFIGVALISFLKDRK